MMKKNILFLLPFILTITFIISNTSCESTFKLDVKQYSQNKCDIEKANAIDENQLNAKLQIQKMIEARHVKDAEEFQNAVNKEMEKCK